MLFNLLKRNIRSTVEIFWSTLCLVIGFVVKVIYRPKAQTLDKKQLVLVRVDSIGDYVLFRNFIGAVKHSDKFKDHDITLIGNASWRGLSEFLDAELIKRYIWIERKDFSKKLFYRVKTLKEIAGVKCDTVLVSNYSRSFYFDDLIAYGIQAKEKVINYGDFANESCIQKWMGNKFCSDIMTDQKSVMFELLRNKFFFEYAVEDKINLVKTKIDKNILPTYGGLPENYALLFIGASTSKRKWNISNFVEVAVFIKKILQLDIVICGDLHDRGSASLFEEEVPFKVYNFVGKTTLLQLVSVISRCDILISNETSAPHFAVAVDVPHIFVLYNGVHCGRFVPYPSSISLNYILIAHPFIERDFDAYVKASNKRHYVSALDINDISASNVIKAVEERCLQ